MNLQERKTVITILAAMIAAVFVGLAVRNVARLNQLARDSAQSALWHEINQQLKAREATQDFPATLSELPLTFPDNGSPGLLDLVAYRREGAGCRVSTTLRGKKLEHRYGPED